MTAELCNLCSEFSFYLNRKPDFLINVTFHQFLQTDHFYVLYAPEVHRALFVKNLTHFLSEIKSTSCSIPNQKLVAMKLDIKIIELLASYESYMTYDCLRRLI